MRTLKNRLDLMEKAQRQAGAFPLFVLNFAGSEERCLRDASGQVWTRRDGESHDVLMERIKTAHPAHGFLLLESGEV